MNSVSDYQNLESENHLSTKIMKICEKFSSKKDLYIFGDHSSGISAPYIEIFGFLWLFLLPAVYGINSFLTEIIERIIISFLNSIFVIGVIDEKSIPTFVSLMLLIICLTIGFYLADDKKWMLWGLGGALALHIIIIIIIFLNLSLTDAIFLSSWLLQVDIYALGIHKHLTDGQPIKFEYSFFYSTILFLFFSLLTIILFYICFLIIAVIVSFIIAIVTASGTVRLGSWIFTIAVILYAVVASFCYSKCVFNKTDFIRIYRWFVVIGVSWFILGTLPNIFALSIDYFFIIISNLIIMLATCIIGLCIMFIFKAAAEEYKQKPKLEEMEITNAFDV